MWFDNYGLGWGLFLLAFSAAIGCGLAGAAPKVNGVRQGFFRWPAGLLGAVLAPIGAMFGWSLGPTEAGFIVGSLAGGLVGGIILYR